MFFGLAMIPGCKGVLHQRVFSSSEDRFSSQNDEITTGVIKGIKALEPLGKEVTHIFDRGHDDQDLLFKIWAPHLRAVVRKYFLTI